jgi:hypothetical protein
MMRLKKSKTDDKETEQNALERRVDAMMSVEKNAAPSPEPETVPDPPAEPVETTVPQLPAQLLKTIGGKSAKSSLKIVKEKPAAEEPSAPEPPPETLAADDPFDDNATDKAVDSIVAEEADAQLAIDDAIARQKAAAAAPDGPGLIRRFFTSPWTWLLIIGAAGVTYAWYH